MFERLGSSSGGSVVDPPDEPADDAAEKAARADRRFRERADRRREASADDDAPDHVVCVVVDALRADTVDPSLTPFLAELSGDDAVSPSTWTFPAVTSLLGGRYPHAHGAMRESDAAADSVLDVTPLPAQSEDVLASERFADAGYETYGAFGFVVPFLALEGRFGTHALYEDGAAEAVLDDHAAWLTDRRADRTFSYLHLADLHEPVDPPADYWDAHDVADIDGVTGWRYEDVVADGPTVERYRRNRRRLYRAAAEYVDNRLGAHYRRIADLADGDVRLVVVGDHGEGFWERARLHAERFADPRPAYCVGHGGAPYEPVVRVPLRAAGLEVPPDRRSSLVDVAPTLLAAAGLDGEATAGESTAGVRLGESVPDDRQLLVEGCRYGYEKKAVYGDGRKLVVSRGDDEVLGLSLPDDRPTEIPAAAEAELRDQLPDWPGEKTPRAEGPTAPPTERSVDGTVEARLERLGYR